MEMMNNDILEEFYLKEYKNFIDVDGIHYGGYQGWLFSQGYISKFRADRSCGLIAASNTLFYMCRRSQPENKNHDCITNDNFIDLTLYLYKFLKPKIYGIPTVPIMINGLNKYAQSMNFEITPFLLVNPKTIYGTIEYIKHALKRNCPIMMVTWNTSIKNLKNHWITITGYYCTKSGEHYIVTSNWGKQEVFNLDEWFEEKSLYKGLLYFLTSKANNKIAK